MEYKGAVASPGVALGRVRRFLPRRCAVERRTLAPEEVPAALAALEAALARAGAELEAVRAAARGGQADIFAAHSAILADEELLEEMRGGVSRERRCAAWAIDDTYESFITLLAQAEDPHIRERTADLRDVRARLLRCAAGAPAPGLSRLEEPAILVAEDLFPSDTVSLDGEKVLGIVTELGGATSHTAIIAKSLGIPALTGVKGALTALEEGSEIILDALAGRVLTDADGPTRERYAALAAEQRARRGAALAYRDREARTRDGVRVEVALNLGAATLKDPDAARYADGVGLLRTEFLYMEGDRLPGEEEQLAAYRSVLEAFGGKSVVLRTLDIGGDKTLPYMELPHEDNPFLGCRALRLCLDRPDLFRTQLRAALRASVYGDLRLMFPMVGSLDDLRAARAALAEAMDSLDRDGLPYRREIPVGIMVEIPAIALMADEAAGLADFASIGTNDLCQYLNAADRLNPAVARYYQGFHPAMFRLVAHVARAFTGRGKDICVCGELGGDPAFAAALVGMGVRHLSMSASAIPAVKQLLANLTVPQAEEAARTALGMTSAGEIETYLRAFAARTTGGEAIV